MGAWGVGLYSDDTACDVRDLYRDHLGDGWEPSVLTDAILDEFDAEDDDDDDDPVVWLALADTQWKLGRLESRVRDRALAIIEKGTDLERWRDQPNDMKKREAVLHRLRDQLLAPQPPPRRVSRRFRSENNWEVGEVVAFRLSSGRAAILRVIGHHEDRGGRSPICELLKWSGEPGALPSEDEVARARIVAGPWTQFMLGAISAREIPTDRIVRLGIRSTPSQEPRTARLKEPFSGYVVILWRRADEELSAWLQRESQV